LHSEVWKSIKQHYAKGYSHPVIRPAGVQPVSVFLEQVIPRFLISRLCPACISGKWLFFFNNSLIPRRANEAASIMRVTVRSFINVTTICLFLQIYIFIDEEYQKAAYAGANILFNYSYFIKQPGLVVCLTTDRTK